MFRITMQKTSSYRKWIPVLMAVVLLFSCFALMTVRTPGKHHRPRANFPITTSTGNDSQLLDGLRQDLKADNPLVLAQLSDQLKCDDHSLQIATTVGSAQMPMTPIVKSLVCAYSPTSTVPTKDGNTYAFRVLQFKNERMAERATIGWDESNYVREGNKVALLTSHATDEVPTQLLKEIDSRTSN